MIIGSKDAVKSGKVYGWAFETTDPALHLRVEAHCSGGAAAGEASLRRPDLVSAGIGEGDHAFEFALPDTTATLDQVKVYAVSPDGSQTELSATANERPYLTTVLEVYSSAFNRRLSELESRLEDCEGWRSSVRPEILEEMKADIEHISRRLDAAEVFLFRIDETLRAFEEERHHSARRGFWRLFGRR